MLTATFERWNELTDLVSTRFIEDEDDVIDRKIVVLVLGSDASKIMNDSVIKRIADLNYRSEDWIDFYLVGWQEIIGPRTFEVSFSPDKFNQSLRTLQKYMNINYSGELDLILLEAYQIDADDKVADLDVSYAIYINISERLQDGTILSANGLLENIIEFARRRSLEKYEYGSYDRGNTPLRDFINQRLKDVALKSIVESIVEMSPKAIGRFVKNVIFMKPTDLSSKEMKLITMQQEKRKISGDI